MGKITWFSVCVILILSCKAVLSLTVAAMGIWLVFFEYILLNVSHFGWRINQDFANSLVKQITSNPEFKLEFQDKDVYLFSKKLINYWCN